MKIIAHIKTDFKEKFGIPRQSGLVENTQGKIIFEKEYRVKEAFRGLEDFSHIWILWQFSEAVRENWSPTVRPPLLGGNKRVGVFATRSPFRPNPIGLSCVKLDKIEYTKNDGPVLYVSGADILDGTPIYDIKPYIPYADSHPDAIGGFTENLNERSLKVEVKDERFYSISEQKQEEIIKILSHDPRPSYKDDSKTYGMKYNSYEIKFCVTDGILTVTSLEFAD
ncbi:MAG: tRNA (N6-threonylcarbamoyladenosine(37)-N6)-methyltransferase TrmO [Clostridia bacterium]|nr:tRNA (N6-threonylcarbamoyladenosine(37)-N6)-methyltransferase TrmO [Clostridia bacterium]